MQRDLSKDSGRGFSAAFLGPYYEDYDAIDDIEDRDDDQPQSSTWRTTGNLLKNLVGVHTIAIPYAFLHAGYAVSCVVFAVVGLLALHGTMLIVRSKRYLNDLGEHSVQTLPQIGFYAFGNKGSYFTDAVIILNQLMLACMHIEFSGEVLSFLVNPRIVWSHLQCIALLLPVVLVACWLPSLRSAAPASLCGLFLVLFGLTETVVYDNSTDDDSLTHFGARWLALPSLTYPLLVLTAVVSYQSAPLVMPLDRVMKRRRHLPSVLAASHAVALCVFIAIGVAGAARLSNITNPSGILYIPAQRWVVVTFCVALMTAAMFGLPVVLWPLLERFDYVLASRKHYVPRPRWWTYRAKSAVIRTAVALVVTGLSMWFAVSVFPLVISFVVSLTSSLVAFVLPAIFHLRLYPKSNQPMGLKYAAVWASDVLFLLIGLASLGACFAVAIGATRTT